MADKRLSKSFIKRHCKFNGFEDVTLDRDGHFTISVFMALFSKGLQLMILFRNY